VLKYKKCTDWAPVAHTCNPSYSGGRDHEDHSSKPGRTKFLQDPFLKKKKPTQKRAGGVAQSIGPVPKKYKVQVTNKIFRMEFTIEYVKQKSIQSHKQSN
jgi:hypothetical protein